MTTLKRLARWETALVLLVVVELLVLGAVTPGFLDAGRLLQSSSDYAWIGIAALPLVLVMISGGIDISIGSVISLSSITLGVVYASGADIAIAVLAALVVGAVAGLVNGVLILVTGAHPIVITLGTLFLYSGIAVGLSGLGGVSAYEGISGMPDAFVAFGNGRFLGVPYQALMFLLVAIVCGIVLHGSIFGRWLRLIGVNAEAARYAGIPVEASQVSAYVATGIGSAVAGIMLSAYFASARPDLGATALLPAVTAVVVGGVSIYGGTGTIIGVFVATIAIGLLTQGLRFAGLSNDVVMVLIGVVLVTAAGLRVISTSAMERIRAKRARGARTAPAQLPVTSEVR